MPNLDQNLLHKSQHTVTQTGKSNETNDVTQTETVRNSSAVEDSFKCKSTTKIMDTREIKCECPIQSIKMGTINTTSTSDSKGRNSLHKDFPK